MYSKQVLSYVNSGALRAVSLRSCAVLVVRTAKPVGLWATSCRAIGFIWSTCGLGHHFLEKTADRLCWAISCRSCAVLVIGTTEPIGLWATSCWTFGFIRPTCGLDELFLEKTVDRLCWAISCRSWSSGQQNQLASGQHPAGHSV